MTEYSVFRNPNPKTYAAVPFLLDVQSEVLSMLGTRVVVPLYRPDAAGVHAMSRLTPVVAFQGQPLVVMVPELAGIPRRELGAVAGDLLSARGEILGAMDLLLTGF
ncbi:MAG TPA: CcdB family protein [Geothrix sp.]|jgi:toxin CcdB